VLSHVVIVARFLDEQAGCDHRIDFGGGGLSRGEELTALHLAEILAGDLDDRVRTDHLKIEHEAAGGQSVSEAAQDVHDVLGLHSSERPGEDDDVVLRSRDLDLPRRPDPKRHALVVLGSELGLCRRDCLGVGVEGEDTHGLLSQTAGQPPFPAADLEHRCALEVGKPAERVEVDAFRIEDGRHLIYVTFAGA